MTENIKNRLCYEFANLKIEYFATADINECRLTKPYLIEKLDFVPKSAIIFLAPYYSGAAVNISKYAAARDYHAFISYVGEKIGKFLKNDFGFSSRAFGDHSPIDERDAAARYGLGIIGDNGLLINEKYGTYVFIGEILTDAAPEILGALAPSEAFGCEHCGRCVAACPMNEIGECLSALTQKKGELSEKEQGFVKKYESAWGCDICQDVCPHNRVPKLTPIEFFRTDIITRLDRNLLLEMSDERFAERAFSWRGREVLCRNLDIIDGKKA